MDNQRLQSVPLTVDLAIYEATLAGIDSFYGYEYYGAEQKPLKTFGCEKAYGVSREFLFELVDGALTPSTETVLKKLKIYDNKSLRNWLNKPDDNWVSYTEEERAAFHPLASLLLQAHMAGWNITLSTGRAKDELLKDVAFSNPHDDKAPALTMTTILQAGEVSELWSVPRLLENHLKISERELRFHVTQPPCFFLAEHAHALESYRQAIESKRTRLHAWRAHSP